MIIKPIKLALKPFEVFQKVNHLKQPVFLDSSEKYEKLGKFSIIAFNPFLKIRSKNNKVTVQNGQDVQEMKEPLKILKDYLREYNQSYQSDLPFIGGAIGHFSYDLCHHFEKLPRSATDDLNIPDLNIGFYYGGIVYSHQEKRWYLTDADIDGYGQKRVDDIETLLKSQEINKIPSEPSKNPVKLRSNMEKTYYLECIHRIKEYIRSGDIYQVNMTQRFSTPLQESPMRLYKNLREVNPAPFGGYLAFDDYEILSSSPERFVKLKQGRLFTRPIKGTRRRGLNEKEDIRLKNELKESEKDQSELLMIVDLERNDFSKVAQTGTVKVPELFVIETYPTVFHLVSQVTCLIDDGYDAVDCIENIFPGGSITGAPKIRSMEVIDELEPTQRNIYTGSIGYIDFNGDMDLNIVIRTMLIKNDEVHFQVGGGIVWDSDPESEYQESLDKGKALVEALKL